MSEEIPMLTAELVVDSAVPRQPVISPDGRWVAYVVATVGRREERRLSALWLAPANGSSPSRKLTAGTAADSGPCWAPDSVSLFFLSDRTGSAQVHRIRLDGGEAEALTDWELENGGLMAYEMMHSMWGYHQPNKPTSLVIDSVADMLDMKPKDDVAVK